MEKNDRVIEKRLAKFSQFIARAGGGMFTTKTRKRLAGILGLAGRDRTKHDFWHDVRKRVKTALVDLQLFIISGKSHVDKVVTRENLKPVVRTLLWHPVVDKDPPDRNRAEIAQLFIEEGFNYLRSKTSGHVTLSHSRTIEEALDLSNYLVRHFKES